LRLLLIVYFAGQGFADERQKEGFLELDQNHDSVTSKIQRPANFLFIPK